MTSSVLFNKHFSDAFASTVVLVVRNDTVVLYLIYLVPCVYNFYLCSLMPNVPNTRVGNF